MDWRALSRMVVRCSIPAARLRAGSGGGACPRGSAAAIVDLPAVGCSLLEGLAPAGAGRNSKSRAAAAMPAPARCGALASFRRLSAHLDGEGAGPERGVAWRRRLTAVEARLRSRGGQGRMQSAIESTEKPKRRAALKCGPAGKTTAQRSRCRPAPALCSAHGATAAPHPGQPTSGVVLEQLHRKPVERDGGNRHRHRHRHQQLLGGAKGRGRGTSPRSPDVPDPALAPQASSGGLDCTRLSSQV